VSGQSFVQKAVIKHSKIKGTGKNLYFRMLYVQYQNWKLPLSVSKISWRCRWDARVRKHVIYKPTLHQFVDHLRATEHFFFLRELAPTATLEAVGHRASRQVWTKTKCPAPSGDSAITVQWVASHSIFWDKYVTEEHTKLHIISLTLCIPCIFITRKFNCPFMTSTLHLVRDKHTYSLTFLASITRSSGNSTPRL
jgi:hypothetical protein